jgi:hypothetical protein
MKTHQQNAQVLVERFMEQNIITNQFTEPVPEDWPIEAWRLLLKVKSEFWDTESLHCWIVHHVYTPEEIVRLLAISPNRRVRSWVASKRNLPKDLFVILSRDEDETVRSRIAQNKKAPREVMESLKDDPSESVRRVVQYNLFYK